MYNLDLLSLPLMWCTCDKSKDRWPVMEERLQRLGFTNTHKINGQITTPYFLGVADGHIEALTKFEPPFIILEDDAKETADFTSIITDVPEGLDALYLGTSHYGMLRGQVILGGCISSNYNDKFVRPYNMLAIHAVVYLTKEYVNKAIEYLNNDKSIPRGCDLTIAEKMNFHSILAVRKPLFYQNDGHSEASTTQILNPLF